MLVYVHEVTPRIRYIFSLFFDSLLPLHYKLTKSIDEYKSYNGPKFVYGKPTSDSDIYFSPSGLLAETGIHTKQVQVNDWQGLKIFFETGEGAFPFDIFSASFYLISRYEEYTTNAFDMHKRFRAQDSLAFKSGFIDKPMVNLWAKKLKALLLEKFPQLKINEPAYAFIPTIDIDIAYAHLGRRFKGTLGSYLRALTSLKMWLIKEKTLTLLRLKKDRYDTYSYQEELLKKHHLRPIYFFLAATRAKYDKNIPTNSRRFKNLVTQLSGFGDIGIHPSYQSRNKPQKVEAELKRVESILHSKITLSRQHFLRVSLPDTYRCLNELGIKHDYSLAYASCPGFRASICTPFPFYDLQAEAVLPVTVHSTILMEGTLKEYMQLSPVNALVVIEKLVKEVKSCNGEFISIWHNHSLEETGEWKGWRKVFESMIELAK